MAPNITETVFALGLSERVVGVTRFCLYPPEAQEKEKVGGFMDPNYEAIAALQPDLVIILPEHEKVVNYLTEFDIRYLVVHNREVSEIIDTIITIGKVCGVEKLAEEIADDINSRMHIIQEKTEGLPRPRVLVSISRTKGSSSVKDVYIAGKSTFYDELITYAGGRNAFEGRNIAYPVLSTEGLLHLNPEIIIDIVSGLNAQGFNETEVLKEWESIAYVDAVKNNRVYIVSEDYIVIPGPRFILFLEDLARIIHPEIKWENG